MLPIADITSFSFQDFPGYTSCIIWLAGCNFRCPYCHNPEFITGNIEKIEEEKVFEFLKSRVGLLDGVVLSGGECCLYDGIYDFIKKIKFMGFLVKIDTNGTNTKIIKKMVEEKLIDFVALDYKAPKDKFLSIANIDKFYDFENTLNFLISSNIDMEIRTTIHTKLLDENDINNIILDLENKKYKKTYHIQNFRNDNTTTLGNLGKQERIINKDLIHSKDIEIFFRNF